MAEVLHFLPMITNFLLPMITLLSLLESDKIVIIKYIKQLCANNRCNYFVSTEDPSNHIYHKKVCFSVSMRPLEY